MTPRLRVQRAVEALPVAIMVIDMTDTILTWNPAAETLFEIPVGNAVARKFRDLDVSYRVEDLRARIEEVKSRHTSARVEDASFTRRSGDSIHIHVTIAPLFESHRMIGVVVCAEEATELARLREQMTRVAEPHATAIEELQSTNEELETTVEELQAPNTELSTVNTELESRTAELGLLDLSHRAVLNSLDQAVIVLDRDGTVRGWNQAAESMFGLRAEQILGRDLGSLPAGDLARLTRNACSGCWRARRRSSPCTLPTESPAARVSGASRCGSARCGPRPATSRGW